jgi:hypothetical protein
MIRRSQLRVRLLYKTLCISRTDKLVRLSGISFHAVYLTQQFQLLELASAQGKSGRPTGVSDDVLIRHRKSKNVSPGTPADPHRFPDCERLLQGRFLAVGFHAIEYMQFKNTEKPRHSTILSKMFLGVSKFMQKYKQRLKDNLHSAVAVTYHRCDVDMLPLQWARLAKPWFAATKMW